MLTLSGHVYDNRFTNMITMFTIGLKVYMIFKSKILVVIFTSQGSHLKTKEYKTSTRPDLVQNHYNFHTAVEHGDE